MDLVFAHVLSVCFAGKTGELVIAGSSNTARIGAQALLVGGETCGARGEGPGEGRGRWLCGCGRGEQEEYRYE